MLNLFFCLFRVSPVTLYLLTAGIDYLLSLSVFLGVYYRILNGKARDFNKLTQPLTFICDAKDIAFVFAWMTWITCLMLIYVKKGSFITLPHKIYFLTKYAYSVLFVVSRLVELILDHSKLQYITQLLSITAVLFYWNSQLLGCYNKDFTFPSNLSDKTNLDEETRQSRKISLSNEFVISKSSL